MLESPATDPGRAAEEMQEVRYLRAVIDTLRQELVTERKLVKGFEADLIAARKERYEATRLLRVLNEETVLAGYPCGDRDRTLANVRALRSDLIALAKMYGEACGELARTRSWLDQADRYADVCEENQRDASNLVAHLSRQRKASEAEAAQLRARLHEAEKGVEAMREGAAMVCDVLAEGAARSMKGRAPKDTECWETVKFCAESAASTIRSLALTPAPEANQEAGDGR